MKNRAALHAGSAILLSLLVLLPCQVPAQGGPPRKGPPAGGAPAQRYELKQAVSDRAQLHTIGFSGLAFLSGDFGASTFIPPGKVCDFFGFQYLRDIDAGGKGHNPMFLDRVVGNVLYMLTDEQEKVFADLAERQTPRLEELARMRLPVIKAFHVNADPATVARGVALDRDAVRKQIGDLFALDAALSLERAEAMASVARSLTPEQKEYLGRMKFGDFSTWPARDEREQMKNRGRGKPQLYNVAFMTYASEFFSWTAGSLEADTYFCPERHGTYFGGFYMKDMPAMGKRDFDISTSVTGDSGRDFIEKILNEAQRAEITTLPDKQRALLKEIVDVRRQVSTEFRKLLAGQTPDRERVLALGRRYGELDGEMSWLYATAFGRVNQSLTAEQRVAMKKLRALDGYTSAPYYIYSRPATDEPGKLEVTKYFISAKGPNT